MTRLLIFAGVVGLTTVACTGGRDTGEVYPIRTGGNASDGAKVIVTKNCGSCHTIPGIREAKGVVGPPLYFFSRRTFIAGQLPNTPDNLTRWVQYARIGRSQHSNAEPGSDGAAGTGRRCLFIYLAITTLP